jgi:hypothetical protein
MKTAPPLTATGVDGAALLEACNYDRRLCAAIVATQDDWQELLESIPQSHARRGVADIVSGIRQALGLDAEDAERIARGEDT